MTKCFSYITALLFIFSLSAGCYSSTKDSASDRQQVIGVLDDWHSAAAKADFNNYFNHFSDNAIFTGTDATERWDKQQFMAYAKPYFDKGKAWSFTAIDRHIYFDRTGNMAWFDELLNTQMRICRGSGVLVKQGTEWKIEQYILSTTIPNSQMDSVIKMKASAEDELIKKLTHQ